MKQFTVEELNEFLETEEYQQLDELSKKTLGSYIKKASIDAVNNASEGGYKLGGNKHNTYDTTGEEEDNEGVKNDLKAAKRTKKIAQAVDKMVRESVVSEKLFLDIQLGNLADARDVLQDALGDKLSERLDAMKQAIAKTIYKESCESPEAEKLEAAQRKAKSVPKKAPKLKDGDGKVVDEWGKAPVKEDVLDEGIRKVGEYKSDSNPDIKATIHRDSDNDEYHVKWHLKGVHQPQDDYFTDNKEDAHHTAKAGIKQHEKIAQQKAPVKESVLDESHEYGVYKQTKENQVKFVKSHASLDSAKAHAKELNANFGSGKYTASDRKSAESMKTFVKESLDEAKLAPKIYHDTYRGALEHAYAQAKSKGYDIHDEDYHKDTSFVDPKPENGKTKRLSFPLTKDGKVQRKQMHVQVYNRGSEVGNRYELNHYIS